MYTNGEGIDIDLKKAFGHLLVAADAGLPIAQHNVAACYQTGKGCQVDLAKACRYYEMAAAQGLVYSQINLGNMYNTGCVRPHSLIFLFCCCWLTPSCVRACMRVYACVRVDSQPHIDWRWPLHELTLSRSSILPLPKICAQGFQSLFSL